MVFFVVVVVVVVHVIIQALGTFPFWNKKQYARPGQGRPGQEVLVLETIRDEHARHSDLHYVEDESKQHTSD